MPTPFLGEIKLVPFNYAPKGWALCNGQTLPIAQNQALFALLGTTYGGNGQTTFQLPNLQSVTVVGYGNGNGLSPYAWGQTFGTAGVTLTEAELAPHNHKLAVSPATGTAASPADAYLAGAAALGTPYDPGTAGVMPNAIKANVGGQAHDNNQPYLVLNYAIALQGIFPSRN